MQRQKFNLYGTRQDELKKKQVGEVRDVQITATYSQKAGAPTEPISPRHTSKRIRWESLYRQRVNLFIVQVTAKSRAHAENQDNDNNHRGSVGIGVEEGAEVDCRTRAVQLVLLSLGQFADRVENTA